MKSLNVMRNSLKYFFLLSIFYIFVIQCIAQNDISSPYSKFGVGNLSPRTNNVLSSMGGVGYALQNPYYINFKNPAAFAAFDSLSFIADFSFSVVSQKLKTDQLSQSGSFAQFDYLAIGLPILKIWRMSAGIMPYSDVGYGILETRSLKLDTLRTVNYQYKGTGGLQLLYWGNAFKVYKGLTIGMNLSYLFGTINSTSYTEYINIDHVLNTMVHNYRYLDGIYFSGGIQYHAAFKEKHNLSFGVVYENSIKVWTRDNWMVLNYFDTYNPNSSFDTIRYEKGIKPKKNTVLPQMLGVGFSYGYKDRVLASIDLTWQNWKKFRMANFKDTLQNNFTTAIGIQYVPNPSSSKYFNKIHFRVGTRFSTGYVVINNHPISEFAISCGLGFPIRTFTTRSTVNVMFEYGRAGTTQHNLILQDYYKVSFNFILQEKWYQRRKIE